MARVFVSVFLAALATGCGVGAEDASRERTGPESTTRPGTTRTTIYFLTDQGTAPIGVRRTIPAKSPYARQALEALLAGPTREEAETGITTALPDGTELLSMTYTRHGADETVDFAGLPRVGADVLQQARIITQITRTLVGVSGIERIWLLNDGGPWGLTLRSGRIDNGPFDYRGLAGWDLRAGCPGTETVTCDRFVALP